MGVIFQPHPGPQQRFMEFGGRYALIGGAAFGGKTDCLRWYPFKQIAVETQRQAAREITSSLGRAIIFRRTMPELREIIDRNHREFRLIDPGVVWKQNDATWTFSCGYKYMVGHMEDAKDWMKYYGFEYTFIGWDELTTFTEEQYDQLDTRLRTKDPVLADMLWNRAGTNPVGPGLEWVRRRFVEIAPPGKVVIRRFKIAANDNGAKATTEERRQIFIPAKVDDNLSVDVNAYKATLLSKGATSTIARQLLHGDWWVVHGAWVGDLWDPAVHVCKPFKIPKSWPRFRSCDYGFANFASVDWWAVDPDGNLICYRNLTVKKHNAEMLAYRIKELEMQNDEWDVARGCSRLSGPLDYESFGQRGHAGPTIAETFFEVGVHWNRCDKDRHAAADQIRWRLTRRTGHPTRVDDKKKPVMCVPGICWFDTCVSPIRTIPALPSDENDPEVPDTTANDHNWDSVAYACLSRPMRADKAVAETDWWDNDADDLAAARRKRTVQPMLGYPGLRRHRGDKN